MYDVGFIGFGEAGQAFVHGWRDSRLPVTIAAYDLLFDDPSQRATWTGRCEALDVTPLESAERLTAETRAIIVAVTADQVIEAARSVGNLTPETLYLDVNSAAPEKKKAAAEVIGTGYLDVAVLSPVHPKRHESPVLIGGPRARSNEEFLQRHFPNAEIVSDEVGTASLVKMIRSIFVKGLESITMECALAAYRAGLAERIFPSLDDTLRFTETKAMADYTMERVVVHGTRRAAEMDEVCDTLTDLGLSSWMSAGAAQTQRAIGALELSADFEQAGSGTADSGKVPPDAEQIAAAVLRRRDSLDRP